MSATDVLVYFCLRMPVLVRIGDIGTHWFKKTSLSLEWRYSYTLIQKAILGRERRCWYTLN